MSKTAVIIGSGFAGLSSAAYLAKYGFNVKLFEKNEQFGGRARILEENGFKFDMGPSWYWMPEIFDNFFADFGKKTSDFYELKRLEPSYKVFFSENDQISLPSNLDDIYTLFESYEAGSADKLREFLEEAQYRYEIALRKMIPKPSLSVFEFIDLEIIGGLLQCDLFNSFRSYSEKHFKNIMLRSIVEFPILFLGATAKETPALYSMMNHADMALGTWYPMGGMNEIIKGFVKVCENLGVEMYSSSPVKKINVIDGLADTVSVKGLEVNADVILAGADYAHVEKDLLLEEYQSYSKEYWNSRVMAPSGLIYYLGTNVKIPALEHHNLFFDESLDEHSREIYKEPQWPTRPLFYVSCTSRTDPSVAPEGHENLFILMPVASGLLNDNEALRESYFNLIMDRLERLCKQNIRDHIVYKKTYAHSDFIQDYNAFKGNAYGLANTLKQTAVLKPRVKSKRVHNLYYAGQLTVPGPGIPPSIISGEIVAKEIAHRYSK
ncbi:MAG: phytoene desaturase [Proteobacteria bacterium]|nr:phytoene desaturase [Pseudomonadota bacterium]